MALSPYKQLELEWKRLHAFGGAMSLLRWDAAVMMPRGSAEFERLQPAAEQVDVVDGLGALIAAIDHARGKRVDAIAPAKPDSFRPQCDPHLVA